jgi:hypothetical protein
VGNLTTEPKWNSDRRPNKPTGGLSTTETTVKLQRNQDAIRAIRYVFLVERQNEPKVTVRPPVRGEREPMHLGMPLHLGSPGIAGIDPLERYERRALSRRNRAVQKFLEMFGVSTRSAHERVDPTGARRVVTI